MVATVSPIQLALLYNVILTSLPLKRWGLGSLPLNLGGLETHLLANRSGRSNIGWLLRLGQKRWCNSGLFSWNICLGALSYSVSPCLPCVHHALKMTKLGDTKYHVEKSSYPQLLQPPIVSVFASLWLQLHERP